MNTAQHKDLLHVLQVKKAVVEDWLPHCSVGCTMRGSYERRNMFLT